MAGGSPQCWSYRASSLMVKRPEDAIARVEALALRVLADRSSMASYARFIAYLVRRCMSEWHATKASRVLAALLRIGWQIKRTSGSHRTYRVLAGLM